MAKKSVLCACGTRNDRTGGRRKCVTCEKPLPKVRMTRHKEALRGDSYPLFVEAAREIHGVTDESCCVCGKPRSQERRHDRDHDHRTGQIRGLACPGNTGCNVLMLPWITAATARGIFIAKAEAGEPEAKRWELISLYLYRCEVFYAAREASAVA